MVGTKSDHFVSSLTYDIRIRISINLQFIGKYGKVTNSFV